MKYSEHARFLLVGGFNTAATYAIYLLLLTVLSYSIAFTVSFACGVLISYSLNTTLVFGTSFRWSRFGVFPLIYVGQYLLGLTVLHFLISYVAMSPRVAPLVVVAITIPVTFLLTRALLKGESLSPPKRGR